MWWHVLLTIDTRGVTSDGHVALVKTQDKDVIEVKNVDTITQGYVDSPFQNAFAWMKTALSFILNLHGDLQTTKINTPLGSSNLLIKKKKNTGDPGRIQTPLYNVLDLTV